MILSFSVMRQSSVVPLQGASLGYAFPQAKVWG